MDKEVDRQITREMGESLARAHDTELFETSAYTGYNIKEMFEKVASLIHIKQQSWQRADNGGSQWEMVNLNNNNSDTTHNPSDPKRKRRGCCSS